MSVPEEIRKVERPKNTVVYDNGKDGPYRYSVRERNGIKYISGKNPQPQNGKVIGHIIDYTYVPLKEKTAQNGPDMLSYGSATLVKSVSEDIFDDLMSIYSAKDVYDIMSIATLRVIKPDISSNRISTEYKRTFVSVHYPGASVSKNSINKLFQNIGKDGHKRQMFYQKRMEAVAKEHHIAIDGTLKQNTSTVNDFSAFSYKSKVKGCKEISVLYAYDIELKEPICAQVFPGNSIDASSYNAFIRDNNINKGIIIADKGFPPSKIKKELEDRPELHFLTPIKRNDTRIKNNNMLDYDGVLKGVSSHVLYTKKQIKGGRFLYAFKSAETASLEEKNYISIKERNDSYELEEYQKKKELFGVIVFESDLDMEPETAYISYEDRWLLELVFNRYKNDECLDKTNVQGDFSVIGSEFINFISTVLTCRILKKARDCGILEKMTFGDMMDDLSSAWRKIDAPFPATTNDDYWVHTLVSVFVLLEALGLSIPEEKPAPKKRGRPKKIKEEKPKKKRGRPRKNEVPNPV